MIDQVLIVRTVSDVSDGRQDMPFAVMWKRGLEDRDGASVSAPDRLSRSDVVRPTAEQQTPPFRSLNGHFDDPESGLSALPESPHEWQQIAHLACRFEQLELSEEAAVSKLTTYCPDKQQVLTEEVRKFGCHRSE